jgi:hypothetical protein
VIELPVTMIVSGAQLWKPNMRKLITTIALLALVDTSVAIAQNGWFAKTSRTSIDELGAAIAPG